MNLKEAFRYQNFLEGMMNTAVQSLGNRNAALTVTKLHKRKAANPDAEDMVETVDKGECYKPEDILSVMQRLIAERNLLSHSITCAKAGIKSVDGNTFDIDAALDTVKFQRMAASSIRSLLRYKASRSIERGMDYKFNAEGNQISYVYEIETSVTEDFNRDDFRKQMKSLLAEADKMSSAIEKAQVDTQVDYTPPFDVNDNFEDIVSQVVGDQAV